MRILVEAGLLLLFAVLFLLMAALAVKAQPAPATVPEAGKPPPVMEDEIIVRGRRDGEPDFQEQWEQHREEYNRLSKIYGPAETPNRRMDRMTDTPNPDAGKSAMRSPGSGTVQGRPSAPAAQTAATARY